LGSALAWAVGQPPAVIYAVFLAVGLGMASPYLLIGAFPQLIRFLPKPGAWMETFKQLMGFVLMGTVVFLLSFIRGPYVVPTVGLLFGIWLACWWIGRTPHTAELGAKMRAWLSAAVALGITFIVTFGWLAPVMESRSSPGSSFSRAAVEGLVASGNTVMVDFTADWCLTCKTLEAAYLNTDKVRQLVQANRVVTLKADWTHGDPEVTKMLETLGSKQVPVIAVFPAGEPNSPIVLIGGYTQQSVLDALKKAGPSRKTSEGRSDVIRAAYVR
jgi:thiol:disulfide interchange protein